MYQKGSFPQTETQSFLTATASPVVAHLAEPGDSGQVLVEYNGNSPVPARLLSHLDRRELMKPENAGREVLLVFEQGNPELPIIVGIMENIVDDMVATEFDQPTQVTEATVDGKKVTFSAENEIVLQCGKSSISLNKEGEIVISGTKLISRASGINRIKGGSVEIN